MFNTEMFIPKKIICPTCGITIKGKADCSCNEDNGYHFCLEYNGKCKICNKIYTWVEHYCYRGYNNVKISNLDESDFPSGYFDKN